MHYAGRVGTGFTVKTIDELMGKLKPLVQKQSPFVDFPVRGQSPNGVHWVDPRLVAQVEFSNWTGDKRLRHPSFQGLREDKAAEEVTLEKPGAAPTVRRSEPTAKPHRSRWPRRSRARNGRRIERSRGRIRF